MARVLRTQRAHGGLMVRIPEYHAALRSRFFAPLLLLAAALPALAQSFQVGTNGNTVWVRIGAGLTGTQCCRGAQIDDPETGASCSIACPANPEIYQEFPCNSVGQHTVYGCVSDAGTNYKYQCSSQVVDVVDPPPPMCPQFTLFTKGTRALTHKFGDPLFNPYSYPPG